MFKDKDKQREAQRNWVRQKRIDKKGSTEIPDGFAIPVDVKLKSINTNEPIISPKRGKDIKCFADLPPDIQQTIKKMSSNDGGVTWDEAEKDRRTAIAVNYQHQFPDRYHSTGVV